jgi:hypothetical protein
LEKEKEWSEFVLGNWQNETTINKVRVEGWQKLRKTDMTNDNQAQTTNMRGKGTVEEPAGQEKC